MPFSASAHVYDAINTRYRDYKSQALRIRKWIAQECPNARSILDVACGTGLHLNELSSDFSVVGVDISSAMLQIASRRVAGGEFVIGAMESFSLERRFDVVMCLFSSITYAGTPDRLASTIYNFANHLASDGLLIVEPYITPEKWKDGLTGLRTASEATQKIAMLDRAERTGRTVVREIGYLIATTGAIQHIREEHRFTLFSEDEYLNAFHAAGLVVEFDPEGFDHTRGMYLAKKRR